MSLARTAGVSRAPAKRTQAAAVLVAPGRVELREAELPEPGPGEVRVRVHGCGVCGSNLPVFEGRPWFSYPQDAGRPGHEGWGTIDAVGEGVPRERTEGSAVAFLSERAFAEYDVVAHDRLATIPPALLGVPLPGEALACGVNVLRRSRVRAGQHVAVVGTGFLGATVVALAAKLGAHVTALSRREDSRALALRLGAERALALDAGDDLVREPTGGRGFDRVVEATGLQEPLDLASRLVREHGRLVIAGYHQDGLRTVDMQSWNWRGLEVVNAHERDPRRVVSGMRRAIAEVERGTLPLDLLLTHRVALGELETAFAALAERPRGFVKAYALTAAGVEAAA